MRFEVLGPLAASEAGRELRLGGPTQRRVLAHLLLRANEVVPAGRLIEAVWGQSPPSAARAALQSYVSRLRSVLGAGRIEGRGSGYVLRVATEDVDALRFEALARRGRRLLDEDPQAAARLLREALELWGGPPFADLPGDAVLEAEAARFEALRVQVVEDRMAAELALGGDGELVGELEALVVAHPLRERLWGQLMLALYRAGRQAEALAAFDRARQMLAEELGIDPSPELQRLQEQVLRQDLALDASAPVAARAAAVRNPYKGLRPFGEADAGEFFGREALTARLVTRLREDPPAGRVLAVVGPSGSGKSSLVCAGLIPALRAGVLPGSEAWTIVRITPGAAPFAALEAALRGVAVDRPETLVAQSGRGEGLAGAAQLLLPDETGELLMVVDQFEELFTLVADERQRMAFLDALVAAVTEPASRVRVVITLRADFFDRPLAHAGLVELLRTRTEIVGPLSAEELERAIAGPAECVGVAVDPGLVAQIIGDVAGQRGVLPLLQYTLTELFDCRADAALTADGYRRLGGLSGALARRAEEVYVGLAKDAQHAARQLMLRLITLGEGSEDTRRRVPRSELLSLHHHPAPMQAAIEAFGSARLVSFDRDADSREPTVEIAHEALIRAWPRLRRWVDDARDDLRVQRRVAAAARDWATAGRDPSDLAAGSRLEQLETWRARTQLTLTPQERTFLEASVAERDRRRSAEDARQARERDLERRSWRRLRALVAVFAAAALAAGGLTLLALRQTGRLAEQVRITTARELAAEAVGNLDVDPERAILLALEAIDTTRSVDGTVLPEAEEALHHAVTASRIVLSAPGAYGRVAWSPDGRTFATEGPEDSGLIDVRDAQTGASLHAWHGHDIDVNDVAFNHDGSMLATAGDDSVARVWDPSTGAELAAMDGAPGAHVFGPSFSPAGSLLAAAWPAEGVVRILDLTSGATIAEWDLPQPLRTAFSPDGTRLAVALDDEPSRAVVVDVATGKEVLSLEGHAWPVNDVAWSPDGRWLATASTDSTARIWEADSGAARFTLHGHTGPVWALDWSADGTRLVTGSSDGTARIWEVSAEGTRELLTLTGQDTASGVWGVAFSPDGSRVLTGAQIEETTQIWDVSIAGGAQWGTYPATPEAPSGLAFTPSGELVAVNGDTLSIWNPTVSQEVLSIQPGAHMYTVEVSPDGTLLAAVTERATLVWDAATGVEAFTLPAAGAGWSNNVAWSPDGAQLAVSSDERILIVDRTGREVATLEDAGFEAQDLAFSPDGSLLVAATLYLDRVDLEASRVKTWDWRRAEIVHELPTVAEAIAFDPTGRRLATAGWEGLGRIWDLASAEQLATLAGHAGSIRGIEFAPDGTRLATAGDDGTVRLWNADSGRQELLLHGHESVVLQARFSPDGTKLASVSPDGSARVWALDLDDLIRIAQRKLTRTLTHDECRQYLHVDHCPET